MDVPHNQDDIPHPSIVSRAARVKHETKYLFVDVALHCQDVECDAMDKCRRQWRLSPPDPMAISHAKAKKATHTPLR